MCSQSLLSAVEDVNAELVWIGSIRIKIRIIPVQSQPVAVK
jgi:hypothetical protein